MMQNQTSLIELLEKVENLKPREAEMRALKGIIKAYIYRGLNEYNSIELHTSGIEALISRLKSGFIKESFRVRLGLIFGYLYLYGNKIRESREHSNAILNQSFYERPKGMAYHYLGHSYLFEDYDNAKEYLNKALANFMHQKDIIKIKEAELTLSFLDSYWKKDKDFTLENEDNRSLINYIYHLIQRGELSLAKELLEQVSLADLSTPYQGFYYFYKGLINDDISSYYQSVEAFLKVHDHFHLQLPLGKLMELGENSVVLNILSSVRGLSYEENNKIFVR